jgi:hypothetical protein
MLNVIRKSAVTVAALGALGLGGAAIADATNNNKSSESSSSDMRAARPQREALSSDVAAKVKAAALAKVPGATVLRTEAGGPYNSAYHAHIKTSDGTRRVVLVDSSFQATAVEAERARGGRGKGRPGGPGETALTGETNEKVEAAVLGKYSGATIVRTETNGDSAAPYESHIKTSAGKELEVLVSKEFEVVEARERPTHP